MIESISGVIISREEYDEYMRLQKKNTPMKKKYDFSKFYFRCPTCNYIVDNAVPKQNYCDRCGQRLIK